MALEGVDAVAELSMKGKTPHSKAGKVYNRNKAGIVQLHVNKTLLYHV